MSCRCPVGVLSVLDLFVTELVGGMTKAMDLALPCLPAVHARFVVEPRGLRILNEQVPVLVGFPCGDVTESQSPTTLRLRPGGDVVSPVALLPGLSCGRAPCCPARRTTRPAGP